MTWQETRTGLFSGTAVPSKVEVVRVVKETKPVEPVVKEPAKKPEIELNK